MRPLLSLLTFALTLALPAQASQGTGHAGTHEYSPWLDRDIPNRLLFGDTHLHTSFSYDAGMVGDKLGPDQAYRFAKGETVTASFGARAKLRRPLDFLLIADHSESMGLAPMLREGNPIATEDPVGSKMFAKIAQGDPVGAYKLYALSRKAGEFPLHRNEVLRPMWDRQLAAAQAHNQPGVFTALLGYEFTSAINMNNLHRVVMFRDGPERVGQIMPFSQADSPDPEQLWAYMADYEEKTGGRVLAIPHNGNLSSGMMFADTTVSGAPLTADYAARRQRWEPIYEVTQIKGDGEAHPLLSPNDEFADFATWDRGNFGTVAKTPAMLPGEYAREALKRGLQYEAELGVNPFKFGLIGSTDSHTSLSTPDENNFFSKATPAEPNAGNYRYTGDIIQQYPGAEDVSVASYESTAGGLVAAWSHANTREAIFDSFARKEVYATTGTRIALRLFAGWQFELDDHLQPDTAAVGYDRGVPMGSDLSQPPSGQPLRLLISAQKDPDGANLDRIQVVKGWLDNSGERHEKVYNAVWSGQRHANSRGQIPALPSTVDGANYSNRTGSAALATVWQDPDFEPNQRAFYYVRVLEIESPTWLAYDKARFGDAAQIPADALMAHQERAYSSPIWYTP